MGYSDVIKVKVLTACLSLVHETPLSCFIGGKAI